MAVSFGWPEEMAREQSIKILNETIDNPSEFSPSEQEDIQFVLDFLRYLVEKKQTKINDSNDHLYGRSETVAPPEDQPAHTPLWWGRHLFQVQQTCRRLF